MRNLVKFAGYDGCFALEDRETRVVIGPHCGGRVLSYSRGDREAIILDPKQDGWTHPAAGPGIDPLGGRLDIGPEMTIPAHPVLWLGAWAGEYAGPRTCRLTSRPDPRTGVQLIREFELGGKASHLRCTQTIRNVSDDTVEYCHWSRTLAPGGGVCVVPLSDFPKSRFPNGYIMYQPGNLINYRPEDPGIKLIDGFLVVSGVPRHPKLGIDSYAGWFAYLMPSNLAFIKKFPVYPERVYNEVAAITISIYRTARLCELEPIGPRETIAPGEGASYTEDWYLADCPFPAGPVDPKKVKALAAQL